jgi:hypothetical protein
LPQLVPSGCIVMTPSNTGFAVSSTTSSAESASSRPSYGKSAIPVITALLLGQYTTTSWCTRPQAVTGNTTEIASHVRQPRSIAIPTTTPVGRGGLSRWMPRAIDLITGPASGESGGRVTAYARFLGACQPRRVVTKDGLPGPALRWWSQQAVDPQGTCGTSPGRKGPTGCGSMGPGCSAAGASGWLRR